jgi:hypothetical protein
MKQLEIEKITGARAKWIVTYNRNGRHYFDGLFEAHGDTAEKARETFLKSALMLKWRVKEVEIQPRD